jgi:hypothetical protein
VGFVKSFGVSRERVIVNNATQLVHFYKSEVTVLQGPEYVGAIKLNLDSHSIRFYCRRCGTSLAGQCAAPIPVVGPYAQLLSGDELPIYLPSLICNFDSVLPGTRPYRGTRW